MVLKEMLMKLNNSFNMQQNLQNIQLNKNANQQNAELVQNQVTGAEPTTEGCSIPGAPPGGWGGGGGGGFNPPGGWGPGGWGGGGGGRSWNSFNFRGVGVKVNPYYTWSTPGWIDNGQVVLHWKYYGAKITITLPNQTTHNDPTYDLHHPDLSQADIDFANELKNTLNDNNRPDIIIDSTSSNSKITTVDSESNLISNSLSLANANINLVKPDKAQSQNKMNFLS